MSYFETNTHQRMHKQSVQSTRVNADLSLSGTLSTSKNCHGQDLQDLWDSELYLPLSCQEKSVRAKEELRLRIGEQEEIVDMRNVSTFESSVGKILESKRIEGKLGMAIKIILLQKWSKRGIQFRFLQEKLIQQYASAKFSDIPES